MSWRPPKDAQALPIQCGYCGSKHELPLSGIKCKTCGGKFTRHRPHDEPLVHKKAITYAIIVDMYEKEYRYHLEKYRAQRALSKK